MTEIPPMSPRERMLRDTDDDQPVIDPAAAERAAAAEAAAQARSMAAATAEFQPDPSEEEMNFIQEEAEPQEALTAVEVEAQLTRLDDLLTRDMPEIARQMEADDALQGITFLLGMGFGADVQTMTLAALSRYRKIKNY